MIMKGDRPCKVIDIKVSKTGKHGHAKCRFTAIDIFDGSKHEDIVPSTHGAMIPVVTRMEYQVIGLEDGYLQLMTDDGEMKEDLQPPTYPEGLGADLEAAIEAAEAEGLTVVVSVRITGRILHHPAPQFIEIWVAHRLWERWRRRPWCRSRRSKSEGICACAVANTYGFDPGLALMVALAAILARSRWPRAADNHR